MSLGPAGPAESGVTATPARRPGSVRRTSSIDAHWPSGPVEATALLGCARDLLTPADDGPAQVLAGATLWVRAARDRTIEWLDSVPRRPQLAGLLGARSGGGFRARLAELLPDERRAGSPLFLLLDDLAPVTLIAPVAQLLLAREQGAAPRRLDRRAHSRRTGICIGYRPGASALQLTADGRRTVTQAVRPALPLVAAADPEGWHELPELPELSLRRARRLDVYLDGVVHVDSMFQDSAQLRDGERFAVHEYRVRALADRESYRLLSVDATPRALPYDECPLAAANVDRLIGTSLADLRDAVLDVLPGVEGCTHLNDALRALSDVPVLASALAASEA